MKKPQRRTGELDYADIGALFKQQSLEPSKTLDVAVLAAAQNAVGQQPEFAEAELAKPVRKFTVWYQFVATAAVLVLAVLLVPTLIQTPEYERENSPAAVRHSTPLEVKAPGSQLASEPAAQSAPQSAVQPAPLPASAPGLQAEEAIVQDSTAADKAFRENLAAPVSARRLRQLETRSEHKAESAAREAVQPDRATASENLQEAEAAAGSLDGVEENVQGIASDMADNEESTAEATAAVEATGNAETQTENLANTMKKSKAPAADYAPNLVPMRQVAPESLVDSDHADFQSSAPTTSSFRSGLSESASMESTYNTIQIDADGAVIQIDKERRLLLHAQEAFRLSSQKWTREIIRLNNADDIEDAMREYVLFKKMYPELADDSRFPEQLRMLAE